MTFTGRLSSKGVSFFQASGIIMKGLGFHNLRCMKGKENLRFRESIFLVLKCCNVEKLSFTLFIV